MTILDLPPGTILTPISWIRPAGNRFNVKVLASVLARANTGPSLGIRDLFFDVKRHLMLRLGKCIGGKVQKIEYPCHGLRELGGCPREGCPRCGGTRVFRTRLVRHAEYDLEGLRFLVPVQFPDALLPGESVDIVGKVSRNPLVGSDVCTKAIVNAFAPHWSSRFTDAARLVASIGPIPPSLMIEKPEDNEVPF